MKLLLTDRIIFDSLNSYEFYSAQIMNSELIFLPLHLENRNLWTGQAARYIAGNVNILIYV